MTGDTDFVALYRELGLRAGCTIEQLKHAYRRRVGELHPDRTGSAASTPRLQRLNRLYAAAIEFQRSHDRLPGAQRTGARMPSHSATPEVEMDVGLSRAVPSTPVQARQVWRYALPLVAAVLMVFWYPTPPDPTTTTRDAARPVPAVGNGMFAPVSEATGITHPGVTLPRITIGMPAARARAIQGEPLNADKTRWDYGPSWIDVHCGRVSGWYSSPLRPLRVEPHTPGESREDVTSTVQDTPGC